MPAYSFAKRLPDVFAARRLSAACLSYAARLPACPLARLPARLPPARSRARA